MSVTKRRRGRVAEPTASLPVASLPRATYRVQLHSGFRFTDATALVPYLAALGISHLYCSPYLRARPGSRHGYDVVDHAMLNPEIGTREAFDAMVDALAAHGMSHLCDVVPNHMAVMGRDNAWWMDVLENGPASRYASYFDIDWTPQDPDLGGKVLVPVLADLYGAVLERGELRLAFERDSGAFAVNYFDHRLPLDPRECGALLGLALDDAHDRLPEQAILETERLVAALRRLPARTVTVANDLAARTRDVPLLKARLAGLIASQPTLADALDEVVRRYNGTPGSPESFEALHRLLEAQAYRLAFWRVASDEINYRRFFDVNDLASLRMENDEVFEATHGFLLGLAAEGRIGGLRIDHPDGLHHPAGYFSRLQSRYRELVASRTGRPAGGIPGLYVVLEKISAQHEHLPSDWPVHGDTGYPFANAITAVLIDPTVRARVDRAWRAFVGVEAIDFEAAAGDGKRGVMRGSLAAGLNGLASRALRIARATRHTRDFTFSLLRDALAETIAWFPVYRTYLSHEGRSAQDRRYIDWAISRARRASRIAGPSVFDFLRSLLLAEPAPGAPQALCERYLDFAMRFQQFTAPVAAKGVEDTAFYTHTRFVALNDVGGDPSQFGMTRRAFHRVTADRAAAWPHTMLATSTHDNKRSEDVRARIDVISEVPAAWRLTMRRWSRMNRPRKSEVQGAIAPSRSDEYLLYQTLVGSFPPENATGAALDAYRERITAYMIKAAREAKARTSWLRVDGEYEQALAAFAGAILAERAENRFLEDLRLQVGTFAWFGMLNSLTMTLVKLTAPGVPDVYQGNEILDYSLVDPDNRRAVDYALRRNLLATLQRIEAGFGQRPGVVLGRLFDSPFDGRAKLWIAYRLLNFRRQHRALFDAGDYVALRATGERGRHVLAFARRHGGHGLVAVAGRLFASMKLAPRDLPLGDDVWHDTALDPKVVPPGTEVTDVLSGASFASGDDPWTIGRLLAHFPGAVLVW